LKHSGVQMSPALVELTQQQYQRPHASTLKALSDDVCCLRATVIWLLGTAIEPLILCGSVQAIVHNYSACFCNGTCMPS